MDLKVQTNTLKLILNMLDRHSVTEGVIPYQPQKHAFEPAESIRLPRSSPERQGIRRDRLISFVRALRDTPECALHSVMILRNGYVVAEYNNAPYRSELWHSTFSMCKSLIGLAIGMLVDDGILHTDDKVVKLLEKYASPIARIRLRDLTVEHLLTMSSGVQFNEAGSVTETDWLQGFLESGLRFEPGEDFAYNSMNSYLLACIICERTGKSVSHLLRQRLWKPLGAGSTYWERSPQGVEKGGWGLYMRVEDMAKLGQLLLNRGSWNGTRIVSEQWINYMCSVHRQVPPTAAKYDYGCQIWVGEHPKTYLMNGMYGQNVLVLPETNTVIAITAGNSDMFHQNEFFDYVKQYFGEDYHPGSALPAPDSHPTGAQTPLDVLGRKLRHAFVPHRAIPSTVTPAVCSLLAGRRFRPKKGDGGSLGLLPLQVQAIQNNYSSGLTGVSFGYEDGAFYVRFEEDGVRHTVPVGFREWRETTLCFAGEPYRVASQGRASTDEDGRPVLIVTIRFLELANVRELRLYPGENALLLRMSENPGLPFVYEGLQSVLSTVRQNPILDTIASSVDTDYLVYKLREGFQPELTLHEVEADSL